METVTITLNRNELMTTLRCIDTELRLIDQARKDFASVVLYDAGYRLTNDLNDLRMTFVKQAGWADDDA